MSCKPGTTEELLEAMRAEAQAEESEPLITVCQGPPRCALHGSEAEAAMMAGCPFCIQITVHADGTETRSEPGEA